jgi:uncharacterized spore protein YtfJ
MKIDGLISTLMKELKKISRTESVVGRPLNVGDTHVVPICDLSIGFGTAGGSGKGGLLSRRKVTGDGDAGGAGGGIAITPVGFVVVGPDGRANLQSLRHRRASALTKAVDLIPKLADQVLPPLESASDENEGDDQ